MNVSLCSGWSVKHGISYTRDRKQFGIAAKLPHQRHITVRKDKSSAQLKKGGQL
jgi:hypothetical protein